MRKKPEPLPLATTVPEGATQVEIDLAIAHVGEHLCRPHKLVRVLGHQLRHYVEPLVIGRIDLLKRLAAKAVSHPRRRQKRRVIAIERTEALRMHATEHMPGNPLHRGKRKNHLLFSHINGCDKGTAPLLHALCLVLQMIHKAEAAA